jgi:hypothetical protein
MNKPLRIILALCLIIFAAGVLLTASYYVAAYMSPDDPSVQDNSMRVTAPLLSRNINGYYYLLQAKNRVALSEADHVSNQKLADYLETGDPAVTAKLTDLFQRNEIALKLAVEADRCQRFQKTTVNSLTDPFWHYRWLIDLERLRILRAYAWFHQGHEKQAFTEIFHVITVGRHCQDSGGSLTTVAAGITLERLGWRTIRAFLRRTTLDESTLCDFLQSGENFAVDANGLGNAFRLEYLAAAAIIDDKKARRVPLFYHPFPELPYAEIMLKPNRTKNQMVHRFQELIDDASVPFERQESRKNQDWRRLFWPVLFTTNPVGEANLIALTYGWDLTLAGKCVANVDGAATQTLLGLKAWQSKHHELPESLDALVPHYLDHLPVDDFSGKPLLYSKSRKVIWAAIEPPVELDHAPAGFSTLRDDTLVFRIPF